jgi:hypothetical protein
MTEVLIMTEQTLPDPEQVLAQIVERQRQMLMAGRKATLDALQGYAHTASAVADSQEKLAAASEVGSPQRRRQSPPPRARVQGLRPAAPCSG